MEPHEEADRLLHSAENDFRALSGMTDPEVFTDEIFGFHAQQALEKSLKAWIALLGSEYPKTHDLSFLLSTLQRLGEEVEGFQDLIDFNPYAVQFRYEAYDEVGNPVDRNQVIQRVKQVLNEVKTQSDRRFSG
ncbi:MAG: HEPN domain-containing protein [Acidobacteriota bacterium]|jgi:HEPN domain-containing protein